MSKASKECGKRQTTGKNPENGGKTMRRKTAYIGARLWWLTAVVVCWVLLAGCPQRLTYFGFDVLLDLAVGPDGSIYVVEIVTDPITNAPIDGQVHQFSGTGSLIRHWPDYWNGTDPDKYLLPVSIAAGVDGRVYVGASDAQIRQFTEDGEIVEVLGDQWDGTPWEIRAPEGLALNSTGSIYVTDNEFCLIREFTIDGSRVRAWGGMGSEPGDFLAILGLAVGPDGSVYATDYGNHRVQRFTGKGKFVRAWGERGSEAGEFYYPDGIAVGPDGSVYVADSGNQRIQQFTATGAFVRMWGREGSRPGEFAGPLRVAVGSDGAVYVANTEEFGNARIQQFSADGKFVRAWGLVTACGTFPIL